MTTAITSGSDQFQLVMLHNQSDCLDAVAVFIVFLVQYKGDETARLDSQRLDRYLLNFQSAKVSESFIQERNNSSLLLISVAGVGSPC